MSRANEELEAQRALLSDFVVDMYKQGGMAPYYEVVLRSTTYREFLTSWRMMNDVATLVNVGDRIERGQVIGLVGNTGDSFGAHLHFQVEVNGVAVDPLVYLSGGNA